MPKPAPRSLREMQNLSHAEFREVEDFLWQGDLSPKRVIQHIIRLSARELGWMGEENANSLRDFWYNPVKPIVERAFPARRDDPEFRFGRRMSQYLSDALSEMVTDGELTYRELNILDDSRDRDLYHTSLEADKILFVEKAAAYRKLKPLARTYELSVISGGGWEATALIEDIAYELENGHEYTLYVLTDYDPTGTHIAMDFKSRAEQLGLRFEDVRHIGIRPDQLDDATVEQQKFRPPVESDYERRWMEQNGIDGRYGLELEAIGDLERKGPALRELVVSEIRDDIRERERYTRDTEDATEDLIARTAREVRDELTEDLIRKLRADAMGHIRDSEAVDITPDGSGIRVEVDIDRSREAEQVPTAPMDGDLHAGAVSGDVPRPDSEGAREAVKRELYDRIEAGEIDVVELLNL